MTNSLLSAEIKKEIAQKIFLARVKILHDHLLATSLPALFLCASLVFLGLYHQENTFALRSWYLATLAICILRVGLHQWYEFDPQHPALHLKLFILGATLSGILWGFAVTVLTPSHHILHRVFIIIIIAGLNAGCSQTLKASRTANFLFILTSILPLAIWFLFQKQPIYTYLSLSIFGYLGFMLFLANKAYIQFINSLQLHYENEILLSQLVSQHEQLKKTNAKLSKEIIEHEHAKRKLKYMASHDFLTGVDNRLFLDSQFEKILTQAKNQHTEFCVMFIDVDHFKQINDNYGHDVGDLALIKVSRLLKQNLRPEDVLVRTGGDEFVILMTGNPVKPLLAHFVQQVYSLFTRPFAFNGHTLFITLSMGSSFFPEDGDNKKILMKKADLALYQAKMLGRNRYEFYKEKVKIETET